MASAVAVLLPHRNNTPLWAVASPDSTAIATVKAWAAPLPRRSNTLLGPLGFEIQTWRQRPTLALTRQVSSCCSRKPSGSDFGGILRSLWLAS